jgi:hypothetical protein
LPNVKNTEMRPRQLITLTPLGKRIFEILQVDDLSEDMVYAEPVDGLGAAQWHFTTYAKIVDSGSEPMSTEALTAWLRHRGVVDEDWLAELLEMHQGRSLNEMDAIYEAMHGSMA